MDEPLRKGRVAADRDRDLADSEDVEHVELAGVERKPAAALRAVPTKRRILNRDKLEADIIDVAKLEVDKASALAGRFVVQVGAFADATKAKEARQKLEKAGLKTYTQVVETGDGKRIRVRVGPFESKAEADKVGEKVKKLDLPISILEL